MDHKKKKGFITLCISLALFASLPLLARAGGVNERGTGTLGPRMRIHRFTGQVVSLDRENKTIMISGRGGMRTFTCPERMAGEINPGEKVRVYFSLGEGEKSIVMKWKKIDNGAP